MGRGDSESVYRRAISKECKLKQSRGPDSLYAQHFQRFHVYWVAAKPQSFLFIEPTEIFRPGSGFRREVKRAVVTVTNRTCKERVGNPGFALGSG